MSFHLFDLSLVHKSLKTLASSLNDFSGVVLDCDHGVTFDIVAARGLSALKVREKWPRGFGNCPKGCGFNGIAYASYEHYLYGDW